ncbi:MAG: response regulator transcription factor, partial [Burkholderiales bacterium]|nr:response regulator transcription factor [Anaerolineae bacterium]
LVRVGLASLLAGYPDYAVVGQIGGGDASLLQSGAYEPDVVMWDLGWEPQSALERITELKDLDLPIVALLPDDAISHAADAWAAGARGLLPQNADADMLVSALASVSLGLVVLHPALSEALFAGERLPAAPAESLTPRELEVLKLLAEGLPNKTIARRLSISEHTVKFHVNAILSKLGAQSRTEAVVRATRMGLVML